MNDSVNYELNGKNYFRGAIGAILGAILGSVPWAIALYFGWFVGWLGFIIGFLSKKGYELFGGKIGKRKLWIVCSATVLGILFGNVSADFFDFGRLIYSGEIEGVTYWDIPLMYFYWISDSEVLISVLKNVGLGLIFGALGVASVFREMRRELNPQAETPQNMPAESSDDEGSSTE